MQVVLKVGRFSDGPFGALCYRSMYYLLIGPMTGPVLPGCCWPQLESFPDSCLECLTASVQRFVGLVVSAVGTSVLWAAREGLPCSFGRSLSPSQLHRSIHHVFLSPWPVPILFFLVRMVSS